MVKLLENRIKHGFDIAKINCPAFDLIKWCVQMQSQGEGVAVDATSAIALGCVFEPHGAVKCEFFPDPIVVAIKVRATTAGFVNSDP